MKLKEAMRGRAILLILNRTDIVDAIGASGVALSSDGESVTEIRSTLFFSKCKVNGLT